MTDLELLARLIQCEAGGEGEDGMKAVATVIVNRLTELQGEYGRQNTLPEVVFAKQQFDCATDFLLGAYNPQNIYNITPEQVNYDIAEWALLGQKLGMVSDALWYFNPFNDNCPQNFPNQNGKFTIRIGDHCFYSPNQSYYLT